MRKVLFKNARLRVGIANDTQIFDLLVENEKFKKVAKNIATNNVDEVVDLNNLLTLPAGIDPHLHFNASGYEELEDFESGSLFAASGGVATVIDMPARPFRRSHYLRTWGESQK